MANYKYAASDTNHIYTAFQLIYQKIGIAILPVLISEIFCLGNFYKYIR